MVRVSTRVGAFTDCCSSHRILEETERVEGQLTKAKFLGQSRLISELAGSLPRYAVSRVSTPISIVIAKAQFFRQITEKLGNYKAVVKLDLFRILRTGCNAHPNRAFLIERYRINVTVGVAMAERQRGAC
jgi:hypothetical protein